MPRPYTSTEPAAAPHRHALLFELIRQSDLAQAAGTRIAMVADADQADLRAFAAMAQRSLVPSAGSLPRR